MSRMTDDGRHEGVVVHIFADGSYGSAWSAGPLATHRADGTHIDCADWVHHTEDEVVAWRAMCTDCSDYHYRECWRGPEWTRVGTELEQDTSRRLVFNEDSTTDGDLGDLIFTDWERHIAPTRHLREVRDAAEQEARAANLTAAAVRKARGDGATWEMIGDAASLSAATAEKRWGWLVGEDR